jgi:hypothetical protein
MTSQPSGNAWASCIFSHYVADRRSRLVPLETLGDSPRAPLIALVTADRADDGAPCKVQPNKLEPFTPDRSCDLLALCR